VGDMCQGGLLRWKTCVREAYWGGRHVSGRPFEVWDMCKAAQRVFIHVSFWTMHAFCLIPISLEKILTKLRICTAHQSSNPRTCTAHQGGNPRQSFTITIMTSCRGDGVQINAELVDRFVIKQCSTSHVDLHKIIVWNCKNEVSWNHLD